MPNSVRLGLVAIIACLFGCVNTPLVEGDSLSRVPMGIGFGVFDMPCKDVKNIYLPMRLQELDIPFEWTDQSEGLLSIGPITEESEDVYSTIRQTYFLKIQCNDELSTSVSGEAILEGLNASGQWVGINDTATIEHYSMQFLQRLDL